MRSVDRAAPVGGRAGRGSPPPTIVIRNEKSASSIVAGKRSTMSDADRVRRGCRSSPSRPGRSSRCSASTGSRSACPGPVLALQLGHRRGRASGPRISRAGLPGQHPHDDEREDRGAEDRGDRAEHAGLRSRGSSRYSLAYSPRGSRQVAHAVGQHARGRHDDQQADAREDADPPLPGQRVRIGLR